MASGALTAAQRKALPDSAFVYPKSRRYPIHDRRHAIAALIMAGRSDTAGDLEAVRRAIKKRYPDLLKGKS